MGWKSEFLSDGDESPEQANDRGERISSYFRRGISVADSIFDRIYPKDVAQNSGIHWTPVKVAMAAAKLLGDDVDRRVLDVGSGAGKFCLVASLTSPGTYVGVERRKKLVEIAQARAQLLGSGARFIHEDVFDLDWGYFDSFYFYNPFYELRNPELRMDDSLDGKGELEFTTQVSATMERLAKLRAKTRIVTYHGFGGEMPEGYELTSRTAAGSGFLNLWVKRR